ncbi:MAG TPA: L-threonylcarbamoyladenylate synthase [Candidatus Saccharimonadales bacterium]|nr:L-threonylcarbamoyladenylate synthase [Candidatus Saccharimonadales bacterium]
MDQVASILNSGGVGVLATDTLYGLVGRALDRAAVERIYRLKVRQPDKPCIILISDLASLSLFSISLDSDAQKRLQQYWPGPVSIVLPCVRADLSYLHRGTKTLACRVPAKRSLRQLLANTGPLVAPSANPEGAPPAETIDQARGYFGAAVDFYRGGRTKRQPSKLIKMVNGKIEVLRPQARRFEFYPVRYLLT